MNILVTGSSGQLARALDEASARWDGLVVNCLGRPKLDLEDSQMVRSALYDFKPEVVINAAAYTAVDQAEDEPDQAHCINAIAAGQIAAVAREIDARIIHLSTDYVFDGNKTQPYNETDEANPNSVYGLSKLRGEVAVRNENARHVILRTAWVYSSFRGNFLTKVLELAATRDELRVVNDQIGSPSSAFDLADAILRVVEDWRKGSKLGLGQTFHLAGDGEASWCEFADTILNESQRLGSHYAKVDGIPGDQWPTKAVRPANSVLDCNKFEDCFGFRLPNWRLSTKKVVRRALS